MQILRPSSLIFHGMLAFIVGGGVAVVGAQTVPYGAWLGLIPFLFILWRGGRRPWRRWRVTRQPFPAEAQAWLEAYVPLYAALGADGRARFERDVQIFLDEQTFEALDGVEDTDTLKLAVAAGAALILFGRPDWELPARRTFLFYPDRFDDDYHDSDYAQYDGMAHPQGPVILTAPAVLHDWQHPGSGHNVVLHELAHLFDFDDSYAEGIPSLMDPSSADAWRQLVRREMRRARLGRSLLRRYAATNPAELFAVAVENFFDRPERLQERHRHLFDALVAFFNLDPRLAKGERASEEERVKGEAGEIDQ